MLVANLSFGRSVKCLEHQPSTQRLVIVQQVRVDGGIATLACRYKAGEWISDISDTRVPIKPNAVWAESLISDGSRQALVSNHESDRFKLEAKHA